MPRLSVLDLRGDRRDPRDRLPRPREAVAANVPRVAEILRDVRERGDAAVRELTQQFDDVEVDDLEVPAVVRRAALDGLPAPMRAALERAVSQVRWFHERARPPDWEDERDGAVMGVWHRPVQRVGVYVPGGKGAFPSTVVMAVVPAQVAGVDEIVLSSPPTGGDGWPDRTVLAAAELLGVDTVLRIGGAQAIAALAYGTVSVPSVDMVVGPGTVWTALAKVQVQAEGVCGIDSMAGPTEIAIIADATADPRVLAADLVAQAEHDELAGVLLVTTFPGIVPEVEAALEREIATTRHRERVETALAGQGTVALVEDVDQAVQVAEAYAAEHLEVHTE